MAARRHFVGCVVPIVALLSNCTSPSGPMYVNWSGDCNAPAVSGWAYLGLEGHDLLALEDTPWGLYAGTVEHGILRCDEDTGEWTPLGLSHAAVGTILFVPGAEPVLLAGMLSISAAQTEAAVFASWDGGATWHPRDGGLSAENDGYQGAMALAADPGNPDRLYMGQSYSMLRSTDGGETWSYIIGGPHSFGARTTAILISPDRDGHVWSSGTTATSEGIFRRSEDWGDTWHISFPFTGLGGSAIRDMTLDHGNPQRLRAVVGSTVIGGIHGIVVSQDGGRSWERVLHEAGTTFMAVPSDGNVVFAAGTKNVRMPDNNEGRLLSDLALYRSGDGGATWTEVEVPDGAPGAQFAVFDSRGRLLIGSGSWGGVWRYQP